MRGLRGDKLEPSALNTEGSPAVSPSRPEQEGLASLDQERFKRLLGDLTDEPHKIIEVRDELNTMLGGDLDERLKGQIRGVLSKLAQRWLFSAEYIPSDRLCDAYQVRQGDLLAQIGQANLVPWELLAQINRIANPKSLGVGQTIKVIHGPFHAFVSLSDFRMDIYLQDTYVRSFPVGLARPGKLTPAGTWLVKDRVRDAAWTDPESGQTLKPGDPNYPLGPVWMPLEGISGEAQGQPSYGIHGTNEPDSIGTASSSGCVRLRNADAETVFNLLMPGHSSVIIARDSKYR